jgi:phosphoribosylformimino-5-aminoimidazole carboxamide ribotide isomerase
MIAIPAIDLRDGACVQLVGGSFDRERVRIADSRAALEQWENAGFRRIHVVDLNAATGRGDNVGAIHELLAHATQPVQVGGGVRTSERVESLIEAGANQVVIGTRGVEDPEWLARIASRHPGRIIVATDVRERSVTTHGWSNTLSLDITDAVDQLAGFALGGLLVTAVHVEGRMTGPDLRLIDQVIDRAVFPVIASGGVASLEDLRNLESAGAAGAVIGMALYTGAFDPRAVAEEFSE